MPLVSGENPTVNLIATGDFTKAAPFFARFEAGHQTKMDGGVPEHWSLVNPDDDETTGDVFLEEGGVHGARAVGLRLIGGRRPMQFRYDPLNLSAGKSYVLSFDYLTVGGAGAARLAVKNNQRNKAASVETALPDTGGQWKSVSLKTVPREDAEFELLLHCYAAGADKAIYFKNLSLIR